MPQLTISDGDLVKKTLRTTLVMLGTTALWLGTLTAVVVSTTGPSSAATGESKSDKADKGAPMGAAVGARATPGSPAMKAAHRGAALPGTSPATKTDPAHTGDPI